jgi:hypothetical protein
MKKKQIAEVFKTPSALPHAAQLGGLTILSAAVIAHSMHECGPRYVEPVCHPRAHIESDGPSSPPPSGRPTIWATGTSTAVASSSIVDLTSYLMKRP